MNINHSYKDVCKLILDPAKADICLNKRVVIEHIIEELPENPWMDIEIVDWITEDDNLLVKYSFAETFFGQVLVANTVKGVCYLGLVEDKKENVLSDLNKRFGYCTCLERQTKQQKQVLDFLDGSNDQSITFHLRGTSYQTEIWRRLIRIPYGKVISYTTLGGSNQYSRAAGTANGRNPIFWIIPCHRVVKSTGDFDNYFWGKGIKKRLLAWEFTNSNECARFGF